MHLREELVRVTTRPRNSNMISTKSDTIRKLEITQTELNVELTETKTHHGLTAASLDKANKIIEKLRGELESTREIAVAGPATLKNRTKLHEAESRAESSERQIMATEDSKINCNLVKMERR